MSITITNIAAMSAMRHLDSANSAIMQAMQRLSSGKRINSAKDDPAGFAIASRMTGQINGMNQAIRNANDGISFAQVAEGGLTTTEEMLQRVRVLAVQASNATNTSERQIIQEEADQILAEVNRIARTLNFNGRNILDGSSGSLTFQIGANVGETLTVSGGNFLTNTYGTYRYATAPSTISGTSSVTGGDITISGTYGTATVTANAGDSAKTIASRINAMQGSTGVTASAKTGINLKLDPGTACTLELTGNNGKPIAISFTTGQSHNPADDLAAAVNAINSQASKTGVTAEVDLKNGGIRLTHAEGSDITLKNTSANSNIAMSHYTANGQTASATTLATGETGIANGTLTYNSPYGFTVTDNSGLSANPGEITTGKLHAVSSIDLSTFDGAQLAINIIDSAINTVNRQRSRYGALQSRFGYIIDNLYTSAENLSAARSRIEDTDYAAETAALAKATILQQVATAMMAQAFQIQRNSIMTLINGISR